MNDKNLRKQEEELALLRDTLDRLLCRLRERPVVHIGQPPLLPPKQQPSPQQQPVVSCMAAGKQGSLNQQGVKQPAVSRRLAQQQSNVGSQAVAPPLSSNSDQTQDTEKSHCTPVAVKRQGRKLPKTQAANTMAADGCENLDYAANNMLLRDLGSVASHAPHAQSSGNHSSLDTLDAAKTLVDPTTQDPLGLAQLQQTTAHQLTSNTGKQLI